MQRVRIGDVELEYEVRGGSVPPLLLIHGALIADAMQPLAVEPALEAFQRITYHRRGYAGSSPVTGPVTMDEHADDAAGLLDHLGIVGAHVVGHSGGARTALSLALRHPELVESLVLLEPALPQVPARVAFFEAMGPVLERFQSGDASGAVHGFLAYVGGAGWRAAVDRTVPGGIEQAERDAATFFTSELGAGWIFGPELAAQLAAVPVLLVLGTASGPIFAESHALLMEWIGGAQEARIAGAGHGLQMEQPAAVAEALAAFYGASAPATP